jgi:hypothetical protein
LLDIDRGKTRLLYTAISGALVDGIEIDLRLVYERRASYNTRLFFMAGVSFFINTDQADMMG